ncbi:MAG: arylamine N-acetyltransferase [bacterium]|nr:arylamine N-acetyltransferase [bacterium]
MSKDLEVYLKKIGVEYKAIAPLSLKEKIAYLNTIYYAHLKTHPYHNFDLREIAQQHPLVRKGLTLFDYKKLLTHQNGGYCFQSSRLLYSTLLELGYSVHCCESRVLNGKKANSLVVKKMPATHIILTVTINESSYFLDPAMGSCSSRMPILIKERDEIIHEQAAERFKLSFDQDQYILYKWQLNQWISVSQSNLLPVADKLLMFNLLKLSYHPDLAIRDMKVVVAQITDEGSKTLFWDALSQKLSFITECCGQYKKLPLPSYEQAYSLLINAFNITHISIADFEGYCSILPQVGPKQAWTVDLPLDSKELQKLALNLSL